MLNKRNLRKYHFVGIDIPAHGSFLSAEAQTLPAPALIRRPNFLILYHRENTKSGRSGKLKISNNWNAISIIALSQNNPLKAIADSMKRKLKQEGEAGIQGEFGIGLLSFWTVGEELTITSAGNDGVTRTMKLVRNNPGYSIREEKKFKTTSLRSFAIG